MYVIIINKMPKTVPMKYPKSMGHESNELQFVVNHDQKQKAILKHKDIFETKKKNGHNQDEVDKKKDARNKVNRKYPKNHTHHNKNNKHHPDYKKPTG